MVMYRTGPNPYVNYILICKLRKFGESCYTSKDIEFFLVGYFLGAPVDLYAYYVALLRRPH